LLWTLYIAHKLKSGNNLGVHNLKGLTAYSKGSMLYIIGFDESSPYNTSGS